MSGVCRSIGVRPILGVSVFEKVNLLNSISGYEDTVSNEFENVFFTLKKRLKIIDRLTNGRRYYGRREQKIRVREGKHQRAKS